MLIRCSILSSKVSSRNFLEADTYRSRELLKGLCNFTQNSEMKIKAKCKKKKTKKKQKKTKKILWTMVSMQWPQNYPIDLVNDNMKSKLFQIPLNLTF